MTSDLFPKIFEPFKKEAEDKINIELAKVLEEKPDLCFRDLMLYIHDIDTYYHYFPKVQAEDEKFFDRLLDIYDCKLSEEERFEILLRIEDRNSFRRFALKHYDDFRKEFAKRVFIPRAVAEELEELEDFQFKLDQLYKDLNYKVEWWYLDNSIEVYKIFGDDIKLFDGSRLVKYFINQLYYLKEEELEELFFYEISRANPQNIGEFLVAFSSREIVDNNSIFRTSIDSDFKIEKVLTSMREQIVNRYSFFDSDKSSSFSKIYNDILRENVGKTNIDNEQITSIFSVSYLRALNELANYSKEKLVGNSLYLKCFKLFLEEFRRYYGEELREDLLIIVETLFKRAIKKKDIFNMLSIKNEKVLWHFYKTDEFVNKFNISLDVIKRSNTKQYKQLKNKYIEYQIRNDADSAMFKRGVINSLEVEMIISLLDVFGFDVANKLIYESKEDLIILLKYLENKSEDYIKAVKKVVGNGFGDILKAYDVKINVFLACFDTLYEQRCSNITIKRLEKSLGSLSYALFPTNFHIGSNLEKLNMVAKGDPLLEKLEGIKLFDKYRFRIESSIPDINGSYHECSYTMVDLHSPEILSNGIGNYLLPNNIKASSCLTPNGKAASCLRHGALNPNGRFFKVECNRKIVAYSWVWRAGDVVCFDNIEVTDELLKIKDYEKVLFDIYKLVAEKLMKVTKKGENRGVKLVVLGRNSIDLANRYFDSLDEVDKRERELFKPNVEGEIYLKDSSEKQLILGGKNTEDIQTKDVSSFYKYQREKVKNFSELEEEKLIRKINAIYFDYCLKNNKKYQSRRNVYSNGFLGEDWFVGVKEDNSYDFYFHGEDERLFLEARGYVDDIGKNSEYKVNIIRPKREVINSILNVKDVDIEIDYEKLNKYLERIDKEQFDLLQEYYTHFPGTLVNFASILENSAITSSEYGKHAGGSGCNGKHYISVAKVGSGIPNHYLNSGTFIISSDICAFSNKVTVADKVNDFFVNSSYPFRIPNLDGEYHVLNSISLDKLKGIFVSEKDIKKLVKIVYLQELFENKLPLVAINDNSYMDKEVIKKYCKIR